MRLITLRLLEFWDRLCDYEAFVSDIVIQESAKDDPDQAEKRTQSLNPFPVLQRDEQARDLARDFIDSRAVPDTCPEDALHIAVAAVNGMDVIVTWNFKHLNNPVTRIMPRKIVEKHGWSCPEICSPEELPGDEV